MKHKNGGAPYSMDANLLHISFEGRHLENPSAEAEESMWRWTVSPEAGAERSRVPGHRIRATATSSR
jgi:argininosuccinate synthase